MIISKGNDKLGKIPNISLPPLITCDKLPCNKKCYALKCYHRSIESRNAWKTNLMHYESDATDYFQEINKYLERKQVDFFRFHVSGDIPDQNYLNGMKYVAKHNPATKFLVFTKKYYLNFSFIPRNLQVVFSVWPGVKLPKKPFPRAYVQDGTETRVNNAVECAGYCHNCFMCWNLSEIGKNVVFKIH